MLFGGISIVAGLLVLWQFSTIAGICLMAVGLFLIGREMSIIPDAPKTERRDYGGCAPTYDLKSTYRK